MTTLPLLLRAWAPGLALVLALNYGLAAPDAQAPPARPPNVIVILADDLGYGELGVGGQARIRTPRLDALAREGVRLTQFYAGSPVCAPSRATLLTGLHTGHAPIRDNLETPGGGFTDDSELGQGPLPLETPTMAAWMKGQGYATALVGKWGLGGPQTESQPDRFGFDTFVGYLDQKQAHNHYPTHLWRGRTRLALDNPPFLPHQTFSGTDPHDPAAYARYQGREYAPDVLAREAVAFIDAHRREPFFLYFAPTLPHLALQVPDSALAAYDGVFPEETPYAGGRQYLPHHRPASAYAAMITRLDQHVGQVLDALDRHGLRDNTMVVFTSDNGGTFDIGGKPMSVLSNGNLRGHKQDVYEGGIRVPFLARWPGRIPAGRVADSPGALWDLWPTMAAALGARLPSATTIDGVSLLPTLTGRGTVAPHPPLYWEYHSQGGRQAVRDGRWKAVRLGATAAPAGPIQLYDLRTDPGEQRDVALAHPRETARLGELLERLRTPSPIARFNFGASRQP